jgi:hypothetical protein
LCPLARRDHACASPLVCAWFAARTAQVKPRASWRGRRRRRGRLASSTNHDQRRYELELA